jgi:hypothetical protein
MDSSCKARGRTDGNTGGRLVSGKDGAESQEQRDTVSLEKLLVQLGELPGEAHEGVTRVSVGEIIHVVGDRSFAPLLMLVGMLLVSPLSGVPTFPSMVAAVVLLVTLQMLFGRRHFWLPARLLQVRVPRDKMQTALTWLQRPARFVDRITRPRLTVMVRGPSIYVIAMICLSIACLLPLMELILFSSSVAGAVLVVFGIALVSRDGLLALLGYVTTTVTVWVIVSALW